jgi:hypothetical protein
LSDFRIIPSVLLILYFIILYISENYFGSYTYAAKYVSLNAVPYFVDLKVLLCGVDILRINQNPYEIVCFTDGAYFNYPKTWKIFTIFPFFTFANYFKIGFILIITFYFFVIKFLGKINFFESIIYSLFLISPSVILGLERGNSDIIIFIFLLQILYIKDNVQIQAALLLIISMLKLYPIGAILMILNDQVNFKKKAIIFVSFTLLFTLFLYCYYENITLVSYKTPRPYGGMSYGLGEIPSLITFGHFKNIKPLFFISYAISLLIWIIYFYYKINIYLNKMVIQIGNSGKAYLMGSGIFIITCLIGYNWEYRLVFLLLTLPQILNWAKNREPLSYIIIVVLLMVVWQTGIKNVLLYFNFRYYNFISAFFVIFLFSFYVSVFLHYILIRKNPIVLSSKSYPICHL